MVHELIAYLRQQWQGLTRAEKIIGPIMVTCMVVFFTGQAIYSASIPGTIVGAKVTTGDTTATFPAVDQREIRGGLVQWQTTTQCRAIPVQRRYTGLMCYAAATDSWRYLKNGTANTNWQKAPVIPVLGVDYFDGRPGAQPLFCQLSSGTRSITYDNTGLNPSPVQKVWRYILYVGGQIVTALRQSWTTSGHIRVVGSKTGATLSPFAQAGYSSNRNDYVALQATYSASAVNGGKRYCYTSVPVAVSKIGATGATGQQGADATVTRDAIQRVMTSTTTVNIAKGGTWQYQPVSPDRTTPPAIVAYRDYSGYVRMKVDGIGYQTFISRTTAYKTQVQDIMVALLLNDVTRLKLDTTGMTGYRSNGTVKFQIYTGVEKALGNPSSDGMCLQSTAAGVRSWGSCGTGGTGSPGGTSGQLQYNRGGAFAGTGFLKYTTVSADRTGVIMTGPFSPVTFYNSRRAAILTIRSSSVVIGGT